jgi:hypothetical protein
MPREQKNARITEQISFPFSFRVLTSWENSMPIASKKPHELRNKWRFFVFVFVLSLNLLGKFDADREQNIARIKKQILSSFSFRVFKHWENSMQIWIKKPHELRNKFVSVFVFDFVSSLNLLEKLDADREQKTARIAKQIAFSFSFRVFPLNGKIQCRYRAKSRTN